MALFALCFAAAQGSGSKASLSLLALDSPLPACLLPGAELYYLDEGEEEEAPAARIETEQDTWIWSITFDQTIVEVEYANEYLFVLAEHLKLEACG